MGRIAGNNSGTNFSVEEAFIIKRGDNVDKTENPGSFLIEIDESTYMEDDIPTNNDVLYLDLFNK